MAAAPASVTMLFSDIEGSTTLVRELGAEWMDVLVTQRSLCREAWTAWRGREMGTEGDSFFVVFDDSGDAIAAALQAQESLASQAWPAHTNVQVRIGIHAGSVTLLESGYVGLDVHRAARVSGAAHGGQVLVTATTLASIAGNVLPGRSITKKLGRHRLKDLPEPEDLVQVATSRLATVFPPPRGAQDDVDQSLIGRERELREIADLVESCPGRLLTVTGAGGSGKTTVVDAVGRLSGPAFPHGCLTVPLSTVTDGSVAWLQILAVANAEDEEELADLQALVILDNLEQIPDAASTVQRLLAAAPRSRVLVTSRRRLGATSEQEYPLAPLTLPTSDTATGVTASAAVQLFDCRARAVNPHFVLADHLEAVSALCHRLDGIPLAIELVAARSRILEPAELLSRLQTALDLTSRTPAVDPRHGSLRATVSWSTDLLSPDAYGVLLSLGAFAGEADLPAIEAVCAVTPTPLTGFDLVDALDDLAEANLVSWVAVDSAASTGRVARIRLLRTVTDYAAEQLADRLYVRDVLLAHAVYLRDAASQLTGEDKRPAGQLPTWVDARYPDIIEALTRTLGPPGSSMVDRDPEWIRTGAELAASVVFGWNNSAAAAQAVDWLRMICDSDRVPRLERERCVSDLALTLEKCGMGREVPLKSVDDAVAFLLGAGRLDDAVLSLCNLSIILFCRPDFSAAYEVLTRAVQLSQQAELAHWHCVSLANRSNASAYLGNLEDSLADAELAIEVADRHGVGDGRLFPASGRACTLRELGRAPEAADQFEAIFADAHRTGNADFAVSICEDYAGALSDLGHHEPAAILYGASDADLRRRRIRRAPMQEAEIEPCRTRSREALGVESWQRAYDAGSHITLEQAFDVARRERAESRHLEPG